MAYRKPHTMDEFVKICVKGDTKLRQTVGADLVAFLADTDNPIECEDIGAFIDALIQWIQGSNYKVAQYALESLTYICDRLQHDFWPYTSPILPHVIDRLGDQKDSVREKSQLFLLKLLEHNIIQPQQLCDKLLECFTHKNAKVREEVLHCIVNILNENGPSHIQFNKLTPGISKLLSDPIPAVRDTAHNTFVEIYKHVGDKLSQDLQKKNCIPSTKLKQLLQRFNEVKENGELLPTASQHDFDEPDLIPKISRTIKRAISTPMNRPAATMSSAQQAGAIDEDSFLNSMEDVPRLHSITSKDVNANVLKDLGTIIGDKNMLWTKRIDALKKIRSLLIAGASSYDDFIQNLRSLGPPLAQAATDGRSQVVREACVTIAFMSQMLGMKFEKVASVLLPNLIGLIQNSAKIVATSGTLCVHQMLMYTHSPPLIPMVASFATTSKSREIRRACYSFIGQIVRTWTPNSQIEKQLGTITDTIKKGIADADNDARVISRKLYWSFKEVYPEAAESLLRNLEPTYRRTLLASAGGDHMSSSSSSSSLNQLPCSSSGYHSSIPRSGTTSGDQTPRAGMRSYTAIDLQAAQRAKARTQYAAMARQKIASGTASLPRPKKTKTPVATPPPSKERVGRTRSRPLGGSISQPTSRSVSPSLRNNYFSPARNTPSDNDTSFLPRPRKLSTSGIPRSTSVSRDHSRETSPTRGGGSRYLSGYSSLTYRGASGASSLRCTPNRDHRPPISPHRPPVMAEKILQQSLEAENALAAALQTDPSNQVFGLRKLHRSLDNHSDDSEASSVCSERSYDSYRRPSDSYSLSGSRTKLSKDYLYEMPKDINEIIKLCASGTWTERKEGLIGLGAYFGEGNMLTSSQLKKVTEIFPKLFMDQNTKVLSLFLDTLNDLIITHHQDLHDWLYMLLQRIFNKLGGELLGSIYKKIEKTLDVIRERFPLNLQMYSVFRYLTDHTQRPNSKVKTTILIYIIHLCEMSNQILYDNQSNTRALVAQGIEKIVTFVDDKKSAEVKTVARNCIMALFNCNSAQFVMLLSLLARDKQEIVTQIIDLRKSSNASITGTGGGVLNSCGSPVRSPTVVNDAIFTTREDIQRSLRNTTAEIQNYSFNASSDENITPQRTRQNSSEDQHQQRNNSHNSSCGVNQLSSATGSGIGGSGANSSVIVVDDSPIVIRSNNNGHYQQNTNVQSPINDLVDGISNVHLNDISSNQNGHPNNLADTQMRRFYKEYESIEDFVNKTEERGVDVAVLSETFNQLASVISNSTMPIIKDDEIFKKLLRILLEQLTNHSDNERIQCAVLNVLTEIFRCQMLKNNYLNYIDLITLKVLDVHKNGNKEVMRHAEQTAAAMVNFPLATIIKIINPYIKTSENYPTLIEGCLKMLTKMIEANGATQLTPELVSLIVPNIIKAYDHVESPVRKCAVFCLVEIYKAVGDDVMKPYMAKLSGSKLKLLNLYIQRAQQAAANNSSVSSTQTTVRMSPASANRHILTTSSNSSSSSTTTTTTSSATTTAC